MENKVRLAVRQLVEFILRSGDIDAGYAEKDRMLEGSRAHRRLQKESMRENGTYQKEVALSGDIELDGMGYRLEGRADGIFTEDGVAAVDEIKTTVLPAETMAEKNGTTHWAQAKCYAYLYAIQNGQEKMAVQLTYYNLDTGEKTVYRDSFTTAQLKEFVIGLIGKYAVWARLSEDWAARRDASIRQLAFPFSAYRKGQRQLAALVYRTIRDGRKLFAQAPTGIGKTISTLFPAVKAMGEGLTSKIFYLTAKTTTQKGAQEALAKMRGAGLHMKSVTITAKEKICFQEKMQCDPDYCPYAKGHFDRVNDAVLDALRSLEDMGRQTVEEYARRHRVCPYEFSLDLAVWADCVLCDYNYVFDPSAYLRRFFADAAGDYVFLIDEAHNLADRAREMYSAQLNKAAFGSLRKEFKDKNRAFAAKPGAISRFMAGLKKEVREKGYRLSPDRPDELCTRLEKFAASCEKMLKEDHGLSENSAFMQLYFDTLDFLMIADYYDERYITLMETHGEDLRVKLYCLDPSCLLAECLRRGGSAVFFSATLTPLPYFREILGGSDQDGMAAIASPFDRDRLCLLIEGNVSTKFSDREGSIARLVPLIYSLVSGKVGNYIIYFPSYKYMRDVYDAFTGAYPGVATALQQPSMDEGEREEFLSRFCESPKKTFAAFCVLGGIFAEGIDLQGSRLIGTAVVGVGLPQLSVELDVIRDYFDRINGSGFAYAYQFPGMNKVLQAAGRVIRSEKDSGAVLLIDRRFAQYEYKNLYPSHWQHYRMVHGGNEVKRELEGFWKSTET